MRRDRSEKGIWKRVAAACLCAACLCSGCGGDPGPETVPEATPAAESGVFADAAEAAQRMFRTADRVERYKNGYARFEKDGQTGVVDREGHAVILTGWEQVGDFGENGLALVCRNGNRGYIDGRGNAVIPPVYNDSPLVRGDWEALWLFEGDVAWPDGTDAVYDGVWRYVDRTGEVLLELDCGYAAEFSEGLARVRMDGKYGYIDRQGETVIPPEWDSARDFSGGLAWVARDGKWGVIDRNGSEKLALQWDDGFFWNGCFVVFQGEVDEYEDWHTGKYGLCGADGRVVFAPEWDYARILGDFLLVEKNGKYGALGPGLEYAVPMEWSWIDEPDRDGLFPAKKGNEQYYIDCAGQVVIQDVWEESRGFSEGLMRVRMEDGYGYVDRAGETVSSGWDSAGDFENGTAVVGLNRAKENGMPLGREYFLIDRQGNILTKDRWGGFGQGEGLFNAGVIRSEGNGLIPARTWNGGNLVGAKWGYISASTGETVLAPEWDDAKGFSEGLALVKKDGEWFAVDAEGKPAF